MSGVYREMPRFVVPPRPTRWRWFLCSLGFHRWERHSSVVMEGMFGSKTWYEACVCRRVMRRIYLAFPGAPALIEAMDWAIDPWEKEYGGSNAPAYPIRR